MRYLIFLMAATILISLSIIYFTDSRRSKAPFLSINGRFIKIEIADTLEERTKGLSGRKYLEKDTGLLFIFPQPDIYRFWMKDMNFPIDIIWISPDWKIVDINEALDPGTYPQTFSPSSTVQYVLEVNAGWTKKNQVKIGNRVEKYF